MNRTKIEDTLLKIGVPAGIKGFTYIADAIEVFEERGTDIGITKELYPAIAKRNKTTPPRVERDIRHALGVARDCRARLEVVDKYIGFTNCTNSNSLKRLHMMLKREETE